MFRHLFQIYSRWTPSGALLESFQRWGFLPLNAFKNTWARTPTRHLLASLEKSGLVGSKGIYRSSFNDNQLNHSFQKLRTYVLVHFSLVHQKLTLWKLKNLDFHDVKGQRNTQPLLFDLHKPSFSSDNTAAAFNILFRYFYAPHISKTKSNLKCPNTSDRFSGNRPTNAERMPTHKGHVTQQYFNK